MKTDYYVFGAGHEGYMLVSEDGAKTVTLASANLVRSGDDRFKPGEYAELHIFPVQKVELRGVIYNIASDEEITPERLKDVLIRKGAFEINQPR